MRKPQLFPCLMWCLFLTCITNQINAQFPPPPYAYEVDPNGAYYVPNQLIIEYNDDWTALMADSIRGMYNVVKHTTCDCNLLELWELPPGTDLDTLSNTIEEKGITGEAEAIIENSGPNFYTNIENTGGCYPKADPLTVKPSYVNVSGAFNPIKIAVLDTGIDYNHPDLMAYLWANLADQIDGIDDDGNCYLDDIAGYNSMNGHNNPMDDNGHGTHVAGIIASLYPPDVPIRIMNVKTHDDLGYADLFSVSCGMLYAINNGAKVVNASWGWYGTESTVFSSIIDKAADKNAILVSSAGNYGLDIGASPRHFPSSLDHDNLIVVTATYPNFQIIGESNYSDTLVDVAVPGYEVLSTMPDSSYFTKTGTSMATPRVAGYAALKYYYASPTTPYSTIISNIYGDVIYESDLEFFTSQNGYLHIPNFIDFADTILLNAGSHLEGPYNGGFMEDTLRARGLIPIENPYNCREFVESPAIFNYLGPNAILDWVFLELIDAETLNLAAERAALMRKTGQIVDLDGVSPVSFYATPHKEYYVILKHRNHLPIMTQNPMMLTDQVNFLNFRSFGVVNQNDMVTLNPFFGHRAMIAGDADYSGTIDSGDRSLSWNQRNQSGYLPGDVNMDGVVDSTDRSMIWNARNKTTTIIK